MAWTTGSGPRSRTTRSRSRPSTYSITRKWTPRSSSASRAATMLGCLSRPAASTSRWNRSDGRLVAGEGRRQDLQRHDPAQPAVPGLEDHAHAALAELVEDQVVADQEPAALALVERGGLVGGQSPGLLEGAGQAEDALGRRAPRRPGRRAPPHRSPRSRRATPGTRTGPGPPSGPSLGRPIPGPGYLHPARR